MSPVKRGGRSPIHNRIGVLRAERSMTRAHLAELVGINVQSVGALERGDNYPSLDLAFRICEVFDLPVEAVFSRQPLGPLSAELYADARTAQPNTAQPNTAHRRTTEKEDHR